MRSAVTIDHRATAALCLEVIRSLEGFEWIGHYGRVTSHFAVLCIDSVDPKPMALFWCDVLGWAIVDQDETDFSIGPASGVGPRIDFLAVPEAKAARTGSTLTCGPTAAPRLKSSTDCSL